MILEIFRRWLLRDGDTVHQDYGSATQPLQTTVTGDPRQGPRTAVLAPGDSKTIWSWADDGFFALLFLESTGYAWVAQQVDLPTSGSDDTPVGGTSGNWFKDAISCCAPRYYEGRAVPTVPSVANAAASAFHATTANGQRYALVVKNPSTATDDITITWGWSL